MSLEDDENGAIRHCELVKIEGIQNRDLQCSHNFEPFVISLISIWNSTRRL